MELFVPDTVAFTFQRYTGVAPPFTAVAVQVTEVPSQIAPDGTAATETLTGRFGLTVIEIVLEVSVFPVVQASSEVNMQVTTSPFSGT